MNYEKLKSRLFTLKNNNIKLTIIELTLRLKIKIKYK